MYDLERTVSEHIFNDGTSSDACKDDYKNELRQLFDSLAQRKFLALGEIGLICTGTKAL